MPVSRKNKKNKRSPSSQKSRERQRAKRRRKESEINEKKTIARMNRIAERMGMHDIF